jgi:selenide,water dikinase
LAGTSGFEDAGVFRLDAERALVQTVDFFPPIVDDPRWFGRIAAANSLSDVYAMGGHALTAMNIVGWPKDLDLEILGEILAGGLEKVIEAGAVLCGGHTVTDTEIKFGLSVTGLVHPAQWWANSGARAGDVLFLTKPVGMGPIATAIKKEQAPPDVARAAMEQMATLNKAACEAVRDLEVHGATDVTGFGLVGHAYEMAAGAGLTLALRASAIPVAAGALDLARAGIYSGGSKRERGYLEGKVEIGPALDPALLAIAFDAETSGGLLLAVPSRLAATVERRLRDAGAPSAACLGEFRPAGDFAILLH